MSYFVYILECADTTLYVGSTNNLEKRVHQHNTSKAGAHYTKIRRPVVLRYTEQVATLSAARAREAQLKRLTRAAKLRLIQGTNKPLKSKSTTSVVRSKVRVKRRAVY